MCLRALSQPLFAYVRASATPAGASLGSSFDEGGKGRGEKRLFPANAANQFCLISQRTFGAGSAVAEGESLCRAVFVSVGRRAVAGFTSQGHTYAVSPPLLSVMGQTVPLPKSRSCFFPFGRRCVLTG